MQKHARVSSTKAISSSVAGRKRALSDSEVGHARAALDAVAAEQRQRKRSRTLAKPGGSGADTAGVSVSASAGGAGQKPKAAAQRNNGALPKASATAAAAAIERMLFSERRQCVRFCAEHECFKFKNRTAKARLMRAAMADGVAAERVTDGERRLYGLRRLLRAAFYPNYSYERAKQTGPRQFASQREATGLTSQWQGSRRGKSIHAQVDCYVNEGRETWLQRFNLSCSPLVGQLMAALPTRQLRPLCAEFIDFYEEHGIASSIDMLCYDEKYDALSLLELKVGGENYFERASGNLIRPAKLRTVNNSPMNQAFLQLLFYRKMIADHYPYVPLGRCYVVQLKQTGTYFRKLMPNFIDASDEVFSAVVRQKRPSQTPRRGAASRGRGGRYTRK